MVKISKRKGHLLISLKYECPLIFIKVRNSESARVSMPGQLTNIETGLCAATDVIINENKSMEQESQPENAQSTLVSSDR